MKQDTRADGTLQLEIAENGAEVLRFRDGESHLHWVALAIVHLLL